MNTTLRRRLLAGLNVHAGEARQVVLMGFFALLPSIGGAIGSPGIEALFFERFGVQYLPYMYVALGAVTMVSTLTLTAVLSRIPKSRLFRWLPVVMAVLLLIARLLVAMDLIAFYPVLWLGMYLFWTLQALLTWGIAGMLFDTRQAKRIFPLFAASSIAGNALGGLMTGPLVSWFGTENLLYIWALTLLLASILANQLTHAYDPPEVHSIRPEPGVRETLQVGGKMVLRSQLLRWFSISTMVLAILLYSLAFPFSKAVTTQFSGEDALAGFLGIFQGATTAFALLISLTFANRFFARFGLIGALLTFALIYALGFGGLLFSATFLGFVIFRFAQQAWMMGVADTAYQATFNIIPPEKREPTRMFVDGIPRQAGVVLSGVFLLTIQSSLPDWQQYGVYTLLAVFCVLTLWRARSAFTRSLAEVLDESQLHIFESEPATFSEFAHDRSTHELLTSALGSENAAVRGMVVEILAQLDSGLAHSKLRQVLDDPVAQIRMRAYQAMIRSSSASERKEYLLRALRDPSPEVRSEGLRMLPKEGAAQGDVRAQVRLLLEDASPEVRALAAGQLLIMDTDSQAKAVLRRMRTAEDSQIRTQALVGYQLWGDEEAYDAAARALDDPSAMVRSRALQTLASIDARRCLKPMKAALGDGEQLVRSSAAQALARVGPGALPTVMEALFTPDLEDGALEALERLNSSTPRDMLIEYIQTQVSTAREHESSRQALRVSASDPPQLQLLHDALRHCARKHTLHALRAFRIVSDRDSVDLAIAGLRSRGDDLRANALELLEALDDRNLFLPVLEIWEADQPMMVQVGDGSDAKRREAAILDLLGSEESWLRACAAFAANLVGNSEVRKQLECLARSDPDPLVRETAAEQSFQEEAMNNVTTLPIMDRILFLRQVPLFSQLTPQELKQVASIAGEHIFNDGEVFVEEGELGDEMFIIVSGNVRVLKGKGQREIALRRPGEFVGEMSILSREPRMASLAAEGDVFALCLEQSNFEQMLLEKPEIGLSVMRALIQRIQGEGEGAQE